MATNKAQIWKDGSYSTIVVPVSYDDESDTCLIYLHSKSYAFDETDLMLLIAAGNVAVNIDARAVTEGALYEVVDEGEEA